MKFEKIRAVFFDAGNTLIFPDYAFIKNVLADHGVQVSVAQLKDAEFEAKLEVLKHPSMKPWKLFFGTWFRALGVAEQDLSEIFAKLWKHHLEKNLWSHVNEEARPVLSALRARGYHLGVISNSDGRLETLLQRVKLADYFEIIIDSEKVGFRKPKAEIFKLALEKFKVSSHETLYVGDIYETDIVGAQNAGLTGILYDPLKKFENLKCLRIQKLSELLNFLSEKNR